MSIGALFTKQWNGNFWGKNLKSSAKGESSVLGWLANAAPELMNPDKREESDKAEAVEAAKAPLSYSRRITADFKTKMLTANRNDKGEVCYSYEASRQKFEVIINVNGDERNYLIKGTDSEGNSFEKEFDPYDVDPENADYTEFTALCLYIQKTDRYADDVMRNFAQPENILEKTNYVGVLFAWSIGQAQSGNMESFEDARRLIVAIQEFTFAKREIELPVSEELIDLLFVEQDEVAKKEAEYKPIESTKAVFSGSAPEKPDRVFDTYYSPEGIRCIKEGEEQSGEDTLQWEIKFENKEQYQKIMQFLSRFPEEDNFLFASKKEFWNDFLNGEVDVDGFMKFYQWTEHGVPNLGVGIDGEQGKISREKITDPNAKYFNDRSWIGKVWTEEELWANWYAKVGAANPAAGEKSGTYYWERAFDSIGKNAPESVKQAWMDAAAVVGADGMGISKNGMMDHISQLMVQRLLKIYRGEKADDILGSSVQSAIKAIDNALYDLEHPLDGNRSRTPEQMKKKEIEKKFYQVFLKRLYAIT